MRFLRRLLARMANFVTRRRGDQRLREEMEEHLALQTAENLRAGMSPSEARRQAVLKFGAAGGDPGELSRGARDAVPRRVCCRTCASRCVCLQSRRVSPLSRF